MPSSHTTDWHADFGSSDGVPDICIRNTRWSLACLYQKYTVISGLSLSEIHCDLWLVFIRNTLWSLACLYQKYTVISGLSLSEIHCDLWLVFIRNTLWSLACLYQKYTVISGLSLSEIHRDLWLVFFGWCTYIFLWGNLQKRKYIFFLKKIVLTF